jgi:hypothetical protein
MVKVWYTPPPFGPRTALDRPPYENLRGQTWEWLGRLAKMPRWQAIMGSLSLVGFLSYVPLSTFVCACFLFFLYPLSRFLPPLLFEVNPRLPHTMSPENQMIQRAYMRYHNINPIYGDSSRYAPTSFFIAQKQGISLTHFFSLLFRVARKMYP